MNPNRNDLTPTRLGETSDYPSGFKLDKNRLSGAKQVKFFHVDRRDVLKRAVIKFWSASVKPQTRLLRWRGLRGEGVNLAMARHLETGVVLGEPGCA
jgi:hypothetical protein